MEGIERASGLRTRRLGRALSDPSNSNAKASSVEPGRLDGGLLSAHISSSRQSYNNSLTFRHVYDFISQSGTIAAMFSRRQPPLNL